MSKEKILLIIDSHALIYRAYYAMPPTLTTKTGEQINAVYGFTSLLLDVINKFQPTNVIAVMDSEGPTIRQADFTQYKANRQKTDDAFIAQIPRVQEVLSSLGIPTLKLRGIEADDIIGTIDNKHAKEVDKVIIVTGDQDIFQLVDENTNVYLAGRRFSDSKLYNSDGVFEKLGITPTQVPDYKAIAGDQSDNIPGVKGIGKVGAASLIKDFGTLDLIYQNIDKVDKRYAQKLIDSHGIALLSKSLATIDKDVPISFDYNESHFQEKLNLESSSMLFEELGFRSIIPKLKKLSETYEVEDQSYLQVTKNEEVENLKLLKWDGSGISSDEVILLTTYHSDNDSPIDLRIKEIFFYNNGNCYWVEEDSIHSFVELIKSKKVVTFNYKFLVHAFLNIGIDILSDNFCDLGFYSVILSCGKTVANLKNAMNFWGKDFEEEFYKNIVSCKQIYSSLTGSDPELLKVVKLEEEVLPLVIDMERKGIKIDIKKFNEIEEILRTKLDLIRQDIFKYAGHEFNINSPQQVSEVLFNEKQLPGAVKTKTGKFSTNERILRKLKAADPIVAEILNFREVDKLLSTYAQTLPTYINSVTGRVHGFFDQMGAVSGRFSSKNPNIQNIPKGETQGVNMREGFVASEGNILVSFDFSQQELRILASLSKEQNMIDSFNQGIDIHKVTASEMFNTPLDEVTDKQRNIGKTLNFSLVYGISSFGLSDRMDIDRNTASEFIKRYFETYPNVKKYFENIVEEIKERGYSETFYGRRRINEMINANNRNLKMAAERELINFVIQGTAADIMKVAMTKIKKSIKKYKANMIAQIHDEFLFEYELGGIDYKKDIQFSKFIEEIKDAMASSLKLDVVYKVDASVGKSWGKMEKL